jgi:hypothetical protein
MSNDEFMPPEKGGAMQNINQGSVSIEQQRAIAEAQGQLALAKRFPRDMTTAHADLMESCQMYALAGVAFYSVPRAGGHVTGPTIRLAEEIARCYGNFQYGHRELSREDGDGDRPGKSEVEVYAWDMERNNRSIRQITVMHTIDTKQGQRKLRDQKDIDDRIANVASKQVRGRILALMPKWMVESAIEECTKTLSGDQTEPLSVRVRKMTSAFAGFGVTPKMLEKYVGHPLDETTSDDMVNLIGVYNSIRDGSPAAGFFSRDERDEVGDDINSQIQTRSKAEAKAEPEKKSKPKTKKSDTPAKTAKQEKPKPDPEPEPEKESKPEPKTEHETETEPDSAPDEGADESDQDDDSSENPLF